MALALQKILDSLFDSLLSGVIVLFELELLLGDNLSDLRLRRGGVLCLEILEVVFWDLYVPGISIDDGSLYVPLLRLRNLYDHLLAHQLLVEGEHDLHVALGMADHLALVSLLIADPDSLLCTNQVVIPDERVYEVCECC